MIKGLLNDYSSTIGISIIVRWVWGFSNAYVVPSWTLYFCLLLFKPICLVCVVILLYLYIHKVWQLMVFLGCRIRGRSVREPLALLVACAGPTPPTGDPLPSVGGVDWTGASSQWRWFYRMSFRAIFFCLTWNETQILSSYKYSFCCLNL